MQGAGGAVGGTVDRAMYSFFIPTALEKAQLIACCTISSGITLYPFIAVALAL